MNTTTQPNPAPAWTPGPWAVRSARLDEGYGLMICGPDETVLARLDTWMGETNEAEMEANARLIAAAPEMAEALAAMLEHEGETVADGIGIEHDGPNLQAAKANARAILARINGEGGGV